MLTPAQIALLDAAANGNLTPASSGPAIPVVQVQQYPGCNQSSVVGATNPSRPIDASRFNTEQCGLVSFYVDTRNTTITTARTLVLGGLIADGDSQVATDIYGMNLAAGGLLADLDKADVVGVNAADFNPLDLFGWLQNTFATKNFIFNNLNIERTAGSVDLTTLGKIRKYSLSIEGDWEVSNPKIQQNFCDPCFQDDGSRVQYNGYFPVTGTDAIALDIPTGIALTFEFCVFSFENAKNMTAC